MKKILLTFSVLLGLFLFALIFLAFWLYSAASSIPLPRDLDPTPLTYHVQNDFPKDTVYIAFHIDSGGVWFSREFGLDLYVQNGDKGFKQTVDSCKEMTSWDENTKGEDMGKSMVCDKKTYTVKLENGKVVFYKSRANSEKEFVTSIPVLPGAKNLVFVNSYKLYSNETDKTLSILGSF